MATKKTNKMSWFIDAYNKGTLDYIIKNTKEDFGTICMPTGTGKSSVVYADVINDIDNNKDGKKLVFNISCPILKLTQQFINDLFDVIAGTHAHIADKIGFFVNSSDSGKNYDTRNLVELGIDTNSFRNIDKKFFQDDKKKIAIVASCHKSLYKFINFFSKKSRPLNTSIYTYIDECHLIAPWTDDDDNVDTADIKKLRKCCDYLYGLSATPEEEITKLINDSDDANYIYRKSPYSAINENIILPPNIMFTKTDSTDPKNTAKLLYKLMKDAKKQNNSIYHKMLVTLNSTTELNELQAIMEADGEKVFSTCAENGFRGTKLDEDADINKFINEVEKYQGDCYVLHIRQLIQGIDIKGLTDCVIWSNSNANTKTYRHIIQIIGRTLRPMANERGKKYSERIKKYGGVYFVTVSEDDKIEKNLQQLVCRYYGFDNVLFDGIVPRKSGAHTEDDMFDNRKLTSLNKIWDNPVIIQLLINIEDYIKENIVGKYEFLKKLNMNMQIEKEISNILQQYDTFTEETNTVYLLGESKDLFDKVKTIFNKYGIH